MNGKGDKDRSTYKKVYKKNFDAIRNIKGELTRVPVEKKGKLVYTY